MPEPPRLTNAEVTTEFDPDRQPQIEHAKLTFTQDSDSLREEVQELTVSAEDASGGPLYAIETKRWSFNTIEDLVRVLDKVRSLVEGGDEDKQPPQPEPQDFPEEAKEAARQSGWRCVRWATKEDRGRVCAHLWRDPTSPGIWYLFTFVPIHYANDHPDEIICEPIDKDSTQ